MHGRQGQLLLFLTWETVISFICNQRLLNNFINITQNLHIKVPCGPVAPAPPGGLLEMQKHGPTPDLLKLNLHFNTYPGRLLYVHQSGSSLVSAK